MNEQKTHIETLKAIREDELWRNQNAADVSDRDHAGACVSALDFAIAALVSHGLQLPRDEVKQAIAWALGEDQSLGAGVRARATLAWYRDEILGSAQSVPHGPRAEETERPHHADPTRCWCAPSEHDSSAALLPGDPSAAATTEALPHSIEDLRANVVAEFSIEHGVEDVAHSIAHLDALIGTVMRAAFDAGWHATRWVVCNQSHEETERSLRKQREDALHRFAGSFGFHAMLGSGPLSLSEASGSTGRSESAKDEPLPPAGSEDRS